MPTDFIAHFTPYANPSDFYANSDKINNVALISDADPRCLDKIPFAHHAMICAANSIAATNIRRAYSVAFSPSLAVTTLIENHHMLSNWLYYRLFD